MSDHDDLRVRLARLDPALLPLDPVESPRAQETLERIMATPVLSDETPTSQRRAPSRRAVSLVAAAAAVIAIAAVSAGIALRDEGSSAPPSTLALSLPPGNVMASCLQFDVSVLRGMSPAFAGTVTSVEGETVVLKADHWYAGGPADEVTLTQPGGQSSVALDGVAFEQGKRYLVTAADGVVNGCGYSGLATPDLEQSFKEAFGG